LISYLLLESDATPAARAVWETDPDWVVPPLWRSEFLSVLVQSARSQMLERQDLPILWQTAAGLLLPREIEPNEEIILDCSLDRGISAYDAHYVSLAIELGALLVSGDQRLVRKCADVAVSLEDFAAQ